MRPLPGCRTLILTTFGRPGYLRRAMDLGVYGFPGAGLADGGREVVADGPLRQVEAGRDLGRGRLEALRTAEDKGWL